MKQKQTKKLFAILAIAMIALIGASSFAVADNGDNGNNPVATTAAINGQEGLNGKMPFGMSAMDAQARADLMTKVKAFRDAHQQEFKDLKDKVQALKDQIKQFKEQKKEITQDMKDQIKALREESQKLRAEFRQIAGVKVEAQQKFIISDEMKAKATALLAQTNFTEDQKSALMTALEAGHIFGARAESQYVFWTKKGEVSWGSFNGNIAKGQDLAGKDVKVFASDGLFVGTEGDKTIWGQYTNGYIGAYNFGSTGNRDKMQTGWYVTYSS